MRYYVVLMLVVGSLVGVAGQDTAQIDFDVASVKPAMPNRPLREVIDATRRHSPGQFRSFDLTFYNLILNAYPQFGLPGLISGGPGWIKEARFRYRGAYEADRDTCRSRDDDAPPVAESLRAPNAHRTAHA